MANDQQKPMREQGPRHNPKDFDRQSLPYDPPVPMPAPPPSPPARVLPTNPDMPTTPGYAPPNFDPTRKD